MISCGGDEPNEEIKSNEINPRDGEKSSDVMADNEITITPIDSIKITHKALIRTSMGNILIGLYGENAPKTVKNFIGLVRKRYYDGILIHRVAKNFVIQMGDRNTINKKKQDEWGKGGQSFFGEPFEDEIDITSLLYINGYQPGVIAMANRAPNTNTSQFFICLNEAAELERRWTIFGRVISGMDVVNEINNQPVIPGKLEPNDGLPVEPIKIISIRLRK